MTKQIELYKGRGRTRVAFSANNIGNEVIVTIYNANAHIGAVALADYDLESGRTSTSVITRLGHKDDIVAQKTAYKLTKNIKKASCVIAGIHIDAITHAEMEKILNNVDDLSTKFIKGELKHE